MKKIILSLFVAGSLTMNAQDGLGFSKGNIAVSGMVGFKSTDDGASTATKTSTFSISPSAMYFLQDNISLNAKLGFGSSSQSLGGTTNMEKSSIGFGIGANYYFMKGQFSPYIGLGVSYDMGTQKFPPSTVETKVNSLGINVMPGLNYFIAKNWALNTTIGSLGYNSTSTTVGSGASVSGSNMGLNLDLTAINFGVSYIFK